MFKPVSMLLLACAALASAAAASAPEAEPARIGPSEAIAAAARAPRTGAQGVFVMAVVSIGRADRRVYLNSEPDYRHPNNLSVELLPRTVRALAARHGAAGEDFLRGRRIEVRGRARRIPIGVRTNGRPVGYYFQTRIAVSDPDQISLVD